MIPTQPHLRRAVCLTVTIWLIASVCEFAGAALVGSCVADTISLKILRVAAFEQNSAAPILGVVWALIGSSTYLTLGANPVRPMSTTPCHHWRRDLRRDCFRMGHHGHGTSQGQ